ncbi:FecR family protein [Prosthecobacter sp.]|uniref:FecR family protein n=1 Tax=Prosthecobacter sp. TaxID=1965333 RepID=UPI002ABB17F7|nr:FecR family protein [Prosthecobacter sp.]MDZ4401899.1 FecR family protein [Prosthecobacter sp.]
MNTFLRGISVLAAGLSWQIHLCSAQTTTTTPTPPWFTKGAVPTDQVLVYAAKGMVKADTASGKGGTVNFDTNEANQTTGIVAAGDNAAISTGAGSSAAIILPTAGAAKLGAETEVRLPPKPDPKWTPKEQFDHERRSHSLELLKGRLFLNIDPEQVKQRGPATFRLKTPSALLAVKGTRFFAETTPAGEVVGVHEGEVIVYHPGGESSVALTAGQVVTVTATEISKPRNLNLDEKKLEPNYAEAQLRREPLKAEWKQPQHPYGKGTKSFHPDNKLGTEYQFALDVNAYGKQPIPAVAAELELDVRKIKRKAVALELVVRCWNLPHISISNAAFFAALTASSARSGDDHLPFQGSSNSAPKTSNTWEWTVVVPFDRAQTDKLPNPLLLKCGILDSIRQFNADPDKQPVIEITGITLITQEN